MSQFNEKKELQTLRRKSRYLEVLHEFALSQVNLNSLDEILWNVARTAIAKLGFVDCVIYLLDSDNKTLVQRAAHGPKNPIAQDIFNPITIKVGDGIVGSVARTGKVEHVADTRKDPRYIVLLKIMCSYSPRLHRSHRPGSIPQWPWKASNPRLSNSVLLNLTWRSKPGSCRKRKSRPNRHQPKKAFSWLT
jgi:putative methionine-R-sulfoxide reductase with GAF domain